MYRWLPVLHCSDYLINYLGPYMMAPVAQILSLLETSKVDPSYARVSAGAKWIHFFIYSEVSGVNCRNEYLVHQGLF